MLWQIGFDSRGALNTLVASAGSPSKSGAVDPLGYHGDDVRGDVDLRLADVSHPLGLFEYQTFDNEDYNVFLADFTTRVNGECSPHIIQSSVPPLHREYKIHQSLPVPVACNCSIDE